MNRETDPDEGGRSTPGGRPRVLFVDDEPQVLKALQWLFRREFDLTLAEGGAQALELLRRQDFHVIVCDQRMPGVSGIEVLREAARIMPGAMRLLLTGYADLRATIDSVNQGEVFRFVTKPWANEELKAVVRLAASVAISLAGRGGGSEAETASPPPSLPRLVLLGQDEETRLALGHALPGRYVMHAADTPAEALDLLERFDVQVLISDIQVQDRDLTPLIRLLKQHRPEIVCLILSRQADARTIVELINQGQIYRVLQKPIKPAQCRLAIQSAVVKHSQLRARPELARRHAVATRPGGNDDADEPDWLEPLLERVRALRRRLPDS